MTTIMTAAHRKVLAYALVATGLGLGCDAGPADVSVESIQARLLRTGNIYPTRRSVPICWSAEALTLPDHATFKQKVEGAAYRSWTQATGMRFVGFDDPCPANTNGMIVINPRAAGVRSGAGIGYRSGGFTNLGLSVAAGGGTIIHEFGHTLGFDHEQERADFPEMSCKAASSSSGDTHSTPPDPQSIMTATGYCNSNQRLSYWDRAGVQRAYGFPNYFPDLQGDGRADAALVKVTGIFAKLSDGSIFKTRDLGSAYTEGPWYGHKGTFFANVDGQGGDEVIAIDDTGVYVRDGNGVSFPASGERRWIAGAWYGELETFFADVTGDGKADIIGMDNDFIHVRPSNGTSFPGPSLNWGAARYSRWGTFIADVAGSGGMGDGKADLIMIDGDGTYVRRSSGGRFEEPVRWADLFVGERGTHLADVNGDKLADLVAVDNNGVRVRLSTGTAFAATERFWITVPWYGTRGTFFADVDGGGAADIIGVDDDGIYVALSNGSNAFRLPSRRWTGSWYAD